MKYEDDVALSLYEWIDFMEECDAFDVKRPRGMLPDRTPHVVVLADSLMTFERVAWNVIIEAWG